MARGAVAPACFIRYAAAATWSFCSTVVTGGRMMSATVVAWAYGGREDGSCEEASVMVSSVPPGKGRPKDGQPLQGHWRKGRTSGRRTGAQHEVARGGSASSARHITRYD